MNEYLLSISDEDIVEHDGLCPECHLRPAGPNGYPCEPCFYSPDPEDYESAVWGEHAVKFWEVATAVLGRR